MDRPTHDIWRRGIEGLAARNGQVDLAAAGDGEEPAEWFRSRLLALGPHGEMVVERPGVGGVAAATAVGRSLHVTIMVGEQRWQGTATVEAAASVALNKAMVVPALRLSAAREVRSGQRRRFYRIALTSLELPGFSLTPVVEDQDVPPLAAHVLNLSAGGVGVRVPLPPLATSQLQRGQLFRCGLGMPELPGLELLARLAHVEAMRGPERGIYLGLQFQFADSVSERRVQDEIVKFVTDVERKQLKRLRGT